MRPQTKFPSVLLDKTTELLIKRLGNEGKSAIISDICEDTGLGYTWLYLISNRKIAQPDVCRIETLYSYLSGKELTL